MVFQSPITIIVSRAYDVPAATVFDAWLDPASAAHWLFATPTGVMVKCEIDPRPGGNFLMVDRRDGQDVAHNGTYLKIDRPRFLEFEFSVIVADVSNVSITIEPTPAGCVLQLVHTMDGKWAEWTERTREGWTNILASLDATLGRHEHRI